MTTKKHAGRRKGKSGSCKPRKGGARRGNTARSRNAAGERSQRQQPPAGGLWWALRKETAQTANVLKAAVQPDTLARANKALAAVRAAQSKQKGAGS